MTNGGVTDGGGYHWARYENGGRVRVDLKKLVDDDGNQTHQMCCICFDYIPLDKLWVDEDGARWDVCPECNLADQLAMKMKEEEERGREQRGREREHG